MRIGIDARLIAETGIGRYIRNVIAELAVIDTKNTYIVFLSPDTFETFVPPNAKWEKRLCTVHWHTIKEQLIMPKIFSNEHLDLLHVPYFNVPIFYSKPFIVTIHDLTILHVATGKATTLPKPLYWIRRIGYQLIVRLGVLRATHIIAVSESTKNDIVQSLHINPQKISVTYEGVDTNIQTTKDSTPLRTPYFLYVGNAYPHKNLEFLIRCFGKFVIKHPTYQLVLVGKNDFFYKRLSLWMKQFPFASRVTMMTTATDKELASYYMYTHAFIFPSLMEGFGLPALEAMKFGAPVLCSDIPVFHELFASIPRYFNPNNEQSLVDAMEQAATGKKKQMREEEKKYLERYQWKTTAKQTLHVYEHALI